MIYAGYVKIAPGKPISGRPQTGWGKLKFLPSTGEAKFSLSAGKKSTGRVSLDLLQRGVLYACIITMQS